VIDRFLTYVKIDTQADDKSQTIPSSKKQLDLARLLAKELNELHLKNVSLDEKGYVMAELPANTNKKLPALGFVAHDGYQPFCSRRQCQTSNLQEL